MKSFCELNDDEDVEDIIWGGYSLIQKKKGFRFGLDAYLLADFINAKPGEKIVDLGTGTGIISFLLAAKGKNLNITALDILPEMVDLVERSIKLNALSNIRVVNQDLRNASEVLGREVFTLAVSNPPYFPVSAGEHSPHHSRAVARTEIMCTLDELVKSTSQLLTYNGRFVFIHRPSRLPEIFSALKAYSLEPKRMRLVAPYPGKEPNGVLIEARKNGGQELKILPTLYVYDQPGTYSKELSASFNRYRKEM